MENRVLCGETILDAAFLEEREILPVQKKSALSIGGGAAPEWFSEGIFSSLNKSCIERKTKKALKQMGTPMSE